MNQPAEEARAVFAVTYDSRHGWMLLTPHMVMSGFGERNDAFEWLLSFFDSNARRAMDYDMQERDRQERLALAQQEMFARLLEPKPDAPKN